MNSKFKFVFIFSVLLSLNAPADESANLASPEIDSDTPVVLEAFPGPVDLSDSREWRPPEYHGQDNALGYSDDAFRVPAGLEDNYKFWLDIYTKFSTDQGVLHDSENIGLIYETLDFSSISRDASLDAFQKERARKKLVNEAKKRVIERLKKLQATHDPNSLSPDERRIWDAYLPSKEKMKFIEAAQKDRLRFQLGQRDRIVQGIFYSGRYLEDFERIFKEKGVPIELTRLAFVESSYNVLARSKVGASGLWQIMPSTGRQYRLISPATDKRNHPIEATKAAAEIFKFNYRLLQSWPLAVTGYNHGPAGVLRLTRLHKTRDLAELAAKFDSRKKLGFASRNFYTSFLAVLEAERNAQKYFENVRWSKPLQSVDMVLGIPVRYAQLKIWFDGAEDRLQIFNPHLTSDVRKKGIFIPKGSVITIPAHKKDEVSRELELARAK